MQPKYTKVTTMHRGTPVKNFMQQHVFFEVPKIAESARLPRPKSTHQGSQPGSRKNMQWCIMVCMFEIRTVQVTRQVTLYSNNEQIEGNTLGSIRGMSLWACQGWSTIVTLRLHTQNYLSKLLLHLWSLRYDHTSHWHDQDYAVASMQGQTHSVDIEASLSDHLHVDGHQRRLERQWHRPACHPSPPPKPLSKNLPSGTLPNQAHCDQGCALDEQAWMQKMALWSQQTPCSSYAQVKGSPARWQYDMAADARILWWVPFFAAQFV